MREGLTAIISVKVSDPVFSSQAKERLTGPNFIEGAVNSVVGEGLAEWLDENPNVATRVVQKAITAAQAREAAKKAADLVKRKSALESDSLPGKLADCSEKDPRECEIFLVEGDSAGRFVPNKDVTGVFRRFCRCAAKLSTSKRTDLDKILGNEEIRAMITAFGTGIADRVNYEELAEQIEHDQQELKFDLSGDASAELVGEVDTISANGTAHADESHVEDSGESDERSGEIFAAKQDEALDAERDDSDADDDGNESKAKSNGVAKRNMRGGKVGAEFDLERLRYHRIIIMCDADVDGSHIRTLLLTFLFRYMRPLVEAGHIYIAKPPLYAVRKGKQLHYAYDDRERDRILAQSRGEVGRFKGLGEMNPEELWNTTMEPEKRLLVQVTMEDAATADEIFSILMGDAVEPRKEFIEKNAKLLDVVNDLDI